MHPKSKFHLYLYFLFASLFLLVGGILLIALRTVILDYTINTILTLEPGSKTYDIWIKNAFPLKFDVYFWNWTNPGEFYNLSTKPHFEQVGPYRYKETVHKVNVSFFDNDTVSFNLQKHWYFESEGSEGRTPEDIVTTIDPVAVSAAYASRNWNYFLRKGVSTFLSVHGPVYKTKSVDEMLFKGYEEPLIAMARKLPLDTLPPFDKFGWFYSRNGSTTFDGHFNLATGGRTRLGELQNWNYWTETPYYADGCGIVEGASYEFFPQELTKDKIGLFNPEMCRKLIADYVEEDVIMGLRGYKYTLGDSFLDNGTIIPENKCYCTGDCVPYGALNVSTCRYGSPGFISLPHFYKADPYYLNLVNGLEPIPDKHNFEIILEPRTGLPLLIKARLQLNLLVQSVSGITMFTDVPTVFFPVLWFEQIVRVPEDLAFMLKLLLTLPVICLGLGVFLLCLGVALILFTFYKICTFNICGKTKKSKAYLPRELVPLNSNKKHSGVWGDTNTTSN